MKYDFSIIIPTYNNLNYLKRALHSLEDQTSKNFETIVIIDGSSDGTVDFLNKYQKKKINLKFINIKPSGGPAKPRNLGINISSGKWICFLDSDDEWNKKKIEELSKVIDKEKFDILYHLEILKNNNFTKVINNKIYKSDFYFNLLLNGNICSTSATIVKSDFIKKNNIRFLENKRFTSVEDYGFWLDIARYKGKFFLLKKVLGTYHLNEKSLTNNILWHKFNMIKLLYHHVFILNKNNYKLKKVWRKILLLYKIDVLFLKIFKLKNYVKIFSLISLFISKPFMLIIYLKRKINI